MMNNLVTTYNGLQGQLAFDIPWDMIGDLAGTLGTEFIKNFWGKKEAEGLTQAQIIALLREMKEKKKSPMEKYLPWIVIGGIGFMGLIMMVVLLKK